MPTKTNSTPGPLTDDSEVWQRSLSILAAIKQVAQEVREEAHQIEVAFSGQLIKPGMGERIALITSLNTAYADLTADVRGIARTSGLMMPEEIR